MSPVSQTVARSFAGDVELEGQPVSVSLGFADGMVHLRLGGESVGTWPATEVAFLPAAEGRYELHADGDSINFIPHQPMAFGAFVDSIDGNGYHSPEPEAADPDLNGGTVDPDSVEVRFLPPAEPVIETPAFSQPSSWEPKPPSDLPTEQSTDAWPLLGAWTDEEEVPTEEEPPALAWETETDDYFAAGLNGPTANGHSEPNGFKSVFTAVAPIPAAPIVAQFPTPTGAHDYETELPAPVASVIEAPVELIEELEPEPPPLVEEATPEPAPLTEDFVVPDVDASLFEPEPTPPDAEPARSESELAGPTGLIDDDEAPKAKRSATALLTRFAKTAPDADATAETEGSGEEHKSKLSGFFEAPDTSDDKENLRQWIIVVCGGLAIVALLTVVILGLASLLSPDESEDAPTTTVATAEAPAVVVAPETTTTTLRVASPSSVEAEEVNSFISEWNELARTYAPNLALESETVPVSEAVTRSIHLSYSLGDPLTLSMTPQGSNADRDLLVAMGMAVAWADPSLSADQRKQVLADLGIDVANPDLAEVGGTVTYGSATYRAAVAGGILKFEATRS